MHSPEHERLNAIARDSWYLKGIAPRTIEYSGKIFARYIRGGQLLELGPAEGTMTEFLVPLVDHVTLVDGAETFCQLLSKRFPQATVVNSLFENFRPNTKFDHIVLGHVLEHVQNPVEILELAYQWLTSNGRVFAAVPNSRSLHRQAAVSMGLLSAEDELNDADIHHGHRRVYNPELLRQNFIEAGFNLEVFGGYWLKPVSNRQIEASWNPEMLDAFMQLGERYPDIAGEIYVIARQKTDAALRNQ